VPERCFLAIELPGPVLRTLARACESFLDLSPAWRAEKWVAPDLLHVTLGFLGEVPDPQVPELIAALTGASACHAPFELRLSSARPVPSGHHATMVWAVMGGGLDPASDLHEAVIAAASRDPDRRPYSPHITLVRARRPRRVHHDAIASVAADLEAAGKTSDGCVSVPSFTLLSSTLGPTGPSYRRLARVYLSGGG